MTRAPRQAGSDAHRHSLLRKRPAGESRSNAPVLTVCDREASHQVSRRRAVRRGAAGSHPERRLFGHATPGPAPSPLGDGQQLRPGNLAQPLDNKHNKEDSLCAARGG